MQPKEQKFIIGRSRKSDIVLIDESVSRRHAELIILSDGKLFLIDCHSQNGTAVVKNGKTYPIRQELISATDSVVFGDITLPVADLLEGIHTTEPVAERERPSHAPSPLSQQPVLSESPPPAGADSLEAPAEDSEIDISLISSPLEEVPPSTAFEPAFKIDPAKSEEEPFDLPEPGPEPYMPSKKLPIKTLLFAGIGILAIFSFYFFSNPPATEKPSKKTVLKGIPVAELTIESTPKGAEVLINGVPKGITPLKLNKMPIGKHQIQVKKEDYATWNQEVNLAAFVKQTLQAQLKPNYGTIVLKTNPPGSIAYIDKKRIGKTPISYKLPKGSHAIEIKKPGFKTEKRDAHIDVGAKKTLTIVLTPATETKTPAASPPPPKPEPIPAEKKPLIAQKATPEPEPSPATPPSAAPKEEIKPPPAELKKESPPSPQITPSEPAPKIAARTPEPSPPPPPKPVPKRSQTSATTVKTGIHTMRRDPKQGARIKNSIGMEFIYIAPNAFLMGSPLNEKQRFMDEKQHKVILTWGYYLQTTEVTQQQWMSVMQRNPSDFKDCGPNCPVENVTWDDIQEFIAALNRLEQTTKYRLPTEAEWEYACRAGTTTPFAFGQCISTEQANYDGNYPYPGCEKGVNQEKTLPVGSLAANAWGFHDMHGNVWEWCQDRYGKYPSGTYTDPVGPNKGPFRVLRGGAWSHRGDRCRSAARIKHRSNTRDWSFGFRIALSPTEKQ